MVEEYIGPIITTSTTPDTQMENVNYSDGTPSREWEEADTIAVKRDVPEGLSTLNYKLDLDHLQMVIKHSPHYDTTIDTRIARLRDLNIGAKSRPSG